MVSAIKAADAAAAALILCCYLKWALFEKSSSGKRESYSFQANRTIKSALFENSSSGKRESYSFQANRTVELVADVTFNFTTC